MKRIIQWLYKPLCFAEGLFSTAQWYWNGGRMPGHFVWFQGHEFKEIHNDAEKQILECERCGHESIGWKD